MLPYSRSALLDVNTTNALQVADAYACVRCLADSISSLPLKVYRRTPAGRVPAGEESRAVQLLNSPSPGSTSADLISQVVAHLNVHGDAFIGKYRSDGEIVQLGLLPPEQVQVELRGQRILYVLTIDGRQTEHSVDDILHIKGMSLDGLRGLSPVSQCRLALSLSANLQEHARQYFENGSRPSGILTAPETRSTEALELTAEKWAHRHGGVEHMHRVAVLAGDVKFTPIAFSADDSQFLQQRELSAREVVRIFRVPAWAIDAPTGDSLTYANVLEQNRAFVTHSLRPWLVRIERALSNDSNLCPGSTYVEFDLDGLLRADTPLLRLGRDHEARPVRRPELHGPPALLDHPALPPPRPRPADATALHEAFRGESVSRNLSRTGTVRDELSATEST
jgi:HK97 family phage portal protein